MGDQQDGDAAENDLGIQAEIGSRWWGVFSSKFQAGFKGKKSAEALKMLGLDEKTLVVLPSLSGTTKESVALLAKVKDLGFADAGYFTRFFQRATGLTPSAWRAGRR